MAAFGLALFAAPMAWIAWRIRRESGVSPLFRQTRIGFRGKRFVIIKFLTMSDGKAVFPFGHRLRDTAMDELPQLVHILRGDMSFVGPRPLIPEELDQLHRIPGGERRLLVRPGLTGLAQINSRKVPALPERLRWDLEYVDRCSFPLDLSVILRSIGITLRASWERVGVQPRSGRGHASA